MQQDFTYSENTQTIRGLTGPLPEQKLAMEEWIDRPYAEGGPTNEWKDLGDTTGAPWEIYIKSTMRDSGLDWGTSTYSDPGGNLNGGNEGEGSINEVQAQILGNDIHRLLKYYLGVQYIVSNIESVKLNIALKSDVPSSLQ